MKPVADSIQPKSLKTHIKPEIKWEHYLISVFSFDFLKKLLDENPL